MQFVLIKAAFLCAGLSLLLVPPTASQDQCTLPTDQDVTYVADELFEELIVEGITPPTVQDLFETHFTCLATVAKDMYSFATVIATFTTTASVGNESEQFQLRCVEGAWNVSTSPSFKPVSMPFYNETQNQCYECAELPASTPNYDSDSHCLSCAPTCLNIGGGFCTGMTAEDCCPFFNGDTGDCVDNCTIIDVNFGSDENFTCVCQISCDPGFTMNATDCSCEFTDGCAAAGQPCQNGGTCTSDLSVMGGPYYNCTCANGYSGMNCTNTLAPITSTPTPVTNTPIPVTDTPTPVTDAVTPSVAITSTADGGCSTNCITESATPTSSGEESGLSYWIYIAILLVVAFALIATITVIVVIIWCLRRYKSKDLTNAGYNEKSGVTFQ